ncbi:MAG: FkbM family methyltransferase [Wenzhouxiangella sp.]
MDAIQLPNWHVAVLEQLRSGFGLARSLLIYRRPGRQAGLRRFYRPFIQPGDRVFDIGAHLGDRSSAFAALGAHVLALEPQPRLFAWLERLTGRSGRVTCLPLAVGAEPGRLTLASSRVNPTVASLSAAWRDQVSSRQAGFAEVEWDERLSVEVTTLDVLIERYGEPSFCKIDVEGFEIEVLRGLSRPLAALSLEFVQGALDQALACIDRLEVIGAYEYQVVAGEQRRFHFEGWLGVPVIRDWFQAGAEGMSSGDLYARRLHG